MKDNTKIWIYGASGHGSVILDCLTASNFWNVGIIDDDSSKKSFRDKIVSSPDSINKEDLVIFGIGDNQIRQKLAQTKQYKSLSIIHPSSTISTFASVGIGTVVFHQCVVQSGTSIGDHCIINTKASIDHDCKVGDYTHISPGAILCGNVTIGQSSWIGAGAVIIQGITIGNNVMVGAGSVIIRDIPDNAVVVGNPGRIIRFRK